MSERKGRAGSDKKEHPNQRVQTQEQQKDKADPGQAEELSRKENQRRIRGEGGMVGKREQEKKEIGGKESINEEEMIMESGT